MVTEEKETPIKEEEVKDPETGEQEDDPGEEKEEPSTAEKDEEEVVVSIDGSPINEEPEKDNTVIREMRQMLKASKRENQELRQRLSETETTKQPDRLGPMPTFESCQYDEEIFRQKTSEWYDKKYSEKLQSEKQNSAWNDKLNAYNEKKKKLRVKDFEESEMVFTNHFNVTQQGLILTGAKDPELVVYALGKNPNKAKKLAAIKNHIEFSFAVARLEAGLKVSSRKPKTTPEKIVKGSGALSGNNDSTLERLRAEAEKTGNYTKVNEHRRKMRARSR